MFFKAVDGKLLFLNFFNLTSRQVLIDVFLARDGEIHKRIFGPQVTQLRGVRRDILKRNEAQLEKDLETKKSWIVTLFMCCKSSM